MRSKEAARLAGVTVRTLRHYHQMGILPEPPRRENGYREYGVVDVARVLRIKRLASLGLSLEQIGAVLNAEKRGSTRISDEAEDGGDAVGLLDGIDAELEAQIAQLEERRRAISLLRRELDEGGAVLETSSPIRTHVSRMLECGAHARTAMAELHQLLIVDEWRGGSASLDDVFGLYRLLEERGAMGEYVRLLNEALSLPDDAGEDGCSELADRIAGLLSPVVAEYLGNGGTGEVSRTDPLLEQLVRAYDDETLSPLQARLFQLAERRVRERVGELFGG